MNITAKLSKSGATLSILVGKIWTHYAVEDLQPDQRVAKKAFRLTKDDGIFWDAHMDEWGFGCTCADASFDPKREVCKHAVALQIVGLFPGGGK